MTTGKIIYIKDWQVECFYIEGGRNVLLAFNGYGEPANDLEKLHKHLGDRYSVVAINLPFHGNTSPKNRDELIEFNKVCLFDLIKKLQTEFTFDKFDLFGYSLGAKLALSCILEFTTSIESIILFAPDGLRKNKWFNMAILNKFSRKFFRYTVKNPSWLFNTIDILRYFNIIPDELKKFVHIHFNTAEKRNMVYNVWWCLRDVVPNIPELKKNIINHNIEIQLFMGKNDKIIKPGSVKKFLRGIEKKCKLKLLDGGHKILEDQYLKYIQ